MSDDDDGLMCDTCTAKRYPLEQPFGKYVLVSRWRLLSNHAKDVILCKHHSRDHRTTMKLNELQGTDSQKNRVYLAHFCDIVAPHRTIEVHPIGDITNQILQIGENHSD